MGAGTAGEEAGGTESQAGRQLAVRYGRADALMSSSLSPASALITFALGAVNFNLRVHDDSSKHTAPQGKVLLSRDKPVTKCHSTPSHPNVPSCERWPKR